MYDDETSALLTELLLIDLAAEAAPDDGHLSPYERAMIAELEAVGTDDEIPEWVAELEAEIAEQEAKFAASRCKIGSKPATQSAQISQESKGCEASSVEAPQCASHSTTYTPDTYPNIDATGFLTPTDQTHRKSRRARWDGCEIATAKSILGDKSQRHPVTCRQISTREPASPHTNRSTAPVRQPQNVRQRIRRKSANVENFAQKSWRDLSPVEKFTAAVWHSAEAGGLSFTLNLGIRREGMLLDHADPRTRMRKNLDKHLRAEGFGKLPIAWVFEVTPPDNDHDGRLHLHGVIDRTGLFDADLSRLKDALRRAGAVASGAIGGQRQLDLSTIPDPTGWADYLLKDTKRTADFLGLDNPFFLSDSMTRQTRERFEIMRAETRKQAA